MKSLSATLIWRAVLAIVIGFIAIAWPGITVEAFVILFAIYAFLAATTEFGVALASRRAGSVLGHVLLALISVAAAITALAWPGITALALVLVIAVWAFLLGVMEIGLAFRAGETAGERALLGLTGLVSVALAASFWVRPDIGAITLAEVYGLFSIVSGVSGLVIAMNVRSGASAQ
jgi:uncharacterized membrane protein HdeD (DUF308 family)